MISSLPVCFLDFWEAFYSDFFLHSTALSVTIKQRGTNQGDTNDTARSSHIDRHCSIIMVSTRETSIYESKYYRTSTLLTPTSSGQLETFEGATKLARRSTVHYSLLTARS